jgi:hypothetical protein
MELQAVAEIINSQTDITKPEKLKEGSSREHSAQC